LGITIYNGSQIGTCTNKIQHHLIISPIIIISENNFGIDSQIILFYIPIEVETSVYGFSNNLLFKPTVYRVDTIIKAMAQAGHNIINNH